MAMADVSDRRGRGRATRGPAPAGVRLPLRAVATEAGREAWARSHLPAPCMRTCITTWPVRPPLAAGGIRCPIRKCSPPGCGRWGVKRRFAARRVRRRDRHVGCPVLVDDGEMARTRPSGGHGRRTPALAPAGPCPSPRIRRLRAPRAISWYAARRRVGGCGHDTAAALESAASRARRPGGGALPRRNRADRSGRWPRAWRRQPSCSEVAGADGRLRPVEELASRLRADTGPRRASDAITMCGSGVTACQLLLAMEHAGLRGARLYPGSWSEWSRDPFAGSRPRRKGIGVRGRG